MRPIIFLCINTLCAVSISYLQLLRYFNITLCGLEGKKYQRWLPFFLIIGILSVLVSNHQHSTCWTPWGDFTLNDICGEREALQHFLTLDILKIYWMLGKALGHNILDIMFSPWSTLTTYGLFRQSKFLSRVKNVEGPSAWIRDSGIQSGSLASIWYFLELK